MVCEPPWGAFPALERNGHGVLQLGGGRGPQSRCAAKSPVPHAPEGAQLRVLMASLLPGTFQIKKECLACRGAAAVFNMSYFGKFYLVGLDAKKAADWLFSADVSRPPGMTSKGPVLLSHSSALGIYPGKLTLSPLGSSSSWLCP